MSYVIGIDPGVSGAYAVIYSETSAYVHDMPVTEFSKTGFVKRRVDCKILTNMMRPAAGVPVFIERVTARPMQGTASMFSLGMSLGSVIGVCEGLGAIVTLVEPKAWKSALGLTGDKEQALELARKLFPWVDLHRKKDHNRAEALLIAHYGRMIPT